MLDHRLHVFRPDLAEQRLEGQVAAERFVTGHRRVVVASATPLKEAPGADAPLGSELIRGAGLALAIVGMAVLLVTVARGPAEG